jgi:hypothetical protein
MTRVDRSLFTWPRRIGAALLGLAALALHACGGGVEGQGTGSFSYSQGPISGLGSIIVNGIRFDDSQAAVRDDDGNTLSSADLKLGMTVQIDAGAIDTVNATAVATAIHVDSDLIGWVSANDVAGGTLTVLGQPVRVTSSTVFDDRFAGGQAAVPVGSVVEVFALYDPVSGVYAARRIEPESAPADFKIRGAVSALDKVAKTFRLGPVVCLYTTAPADLADGKIVRAKMDVTPNDDRQWLVTDLVSGTRLPPDGSEAEIESVISAYTSNADFTVSGVKVDASAARIEPTGSTLAAGLRVEVEGTMRGGVLVATKVEVKGRGDGSDDDGGGGEVEVSGKITRLDTATQTFVVREQTIHYATAEFDDGKTEADLAVDKKVEVKGRLSPDGTEVIAERVGFED